MMLLDLPAEVLSNIVSVTPPDDFESLALTCKTIYNIAGFRRQYHRQSFREPVSKDNDGKFVPDGTIAAVPQLLLSIAQDPGIASFIVHLDLRGRMGLADMRRDYCRHSWSALLDNTDSTASKRLLSNLVASSDHLSTLGLSSEDWTSRIIADEVDDYDRCDFATAFLLSLLPNLKSLALPIWLPCNVDPSKSDEPLDECAQGVSKLVRLLVQRANNVSLQNQALGTLQVLHAPATADWQHQDGVDLAAIIPFMSLRSLRRARHNMGDLNTSHTESDGVPWQLYRPIGMNMEVLELHDFSLDERSSQLLFEDMKNLDMLKLEYQAKDYVDSSYGPQELIDTLMRASGKALKVLSLTISWGFAVYEIYPPIRNMRGFRSLRRVELDTSLFYQFDGGDGEEDDDELDDEDDAENKDDEDVEIEDDEDAENSNDGDIEIEDDEDAETSDDEDVEIEDDENAENNDDNIHVDDTNDPGCSDNGEGENDWESSEEEESDEEEDDSPTGCPNLLKLLRKSLHTLQQVVIHVPAKKRDLTCLQRLLNGVNLPHKTIPNLNQLKVVLYHQDHCANHPENAHEIVSRAQKYLSRLAGIEIEVRPFQDY